MKVLPLKSKLSLEVGTIHFVGIGGIGMSGIAEVLHNLGFKIQGSDLKANPNTERLEKMGVKVLIGQKAENVEGVDVLVRSTAVKYDNPEIIAARANHIPVVKRSEMLAELMRLRLAIAIGGTHGKTTTTSMVAAILDEGDLDPTVINGGIINTKGTNAYLGESEWMVVEADESDGTFNKIPASVAVVTNIEPEHLDFHGSWENLKQAFRNFVSNIPFYGFAVMCLDHPEVQNLIGEIEDRRILTYGTSPQADVRAVNIQPNELGSSFEVELNGENLGEINLPMAGNHNVLNALAAITVAGELGIKFSQIQKAFEKFGGVKRRFTKVGEVAGITIIDDYGHHPTEIAATLEAASQVAKGKVIAVVQPHRFTRVRDLWEEFCKCFNAADKVVITNIYPAGEEPIEGITQQELAKAVKAHSHKDVIALEDDSDLAKEVIQRSQAGDFVVCLGAGSITNMAAELPKQLEELNAA